jgi:putative hydrolases of HD superfamily
MTMFGCLEYAPIARSIAETQETMNTERFAQQMSFLVEIDKIKSIFRRTKLFDGSRHENDAEHAWHLALMAMTLAEYAEGAELNVSVVIKMVLLHDIVEIDAGDTFVYDTQARADAAEREALAAARIFGLLPTDQRQEFQALWEEFEARDTAEAKFAAAIDRLEPILQNMLTGGPAWREHGITRDQVEAANCHIADGSEPMWQYVQELLEEADEKGYFA